MFPLLLQQDGVSGGGGGGKSLRDCAQELASPMREELLRQRGYALAVPKRRATLGAKEGLSPSVRPGVRVLDLVLAQRMETDISNGVRLGTS